MNPSTLSHHSQLATLGCANLSIRKPGFSVRGNKNTISSGRASLTTINYRVPGIIRRKPLKALIKPVIQPLDFRWLKNAAARGGPNWHGRGGPNLFDTALQNSFESLMRVLIYRRSSSLSLFLSFLCLPISLSRCLNTRRDLFYTSATPSLAYSLSIYLSHSLYLSLRRCSRLFATRRFNPPMSTFIAFVRAFSARI